MNGVSNNLIMHYQRFIHVQGHELPKLGRRLNIRDDNGNLQFRRRMTSLVLVQNRRDEERFRQ